LSLTPGAQLIAPWGGALIDLLVPPEALDDTKAYANRLPSIQLSARAVSDLELLATGGFSPLDRFMGEADYKRVLAEMRLANGHLFPIPVTLPVDPDPSIRVGTDVALRDSRNNLLAVMTVDEIYEWDRDEEARTVFGVLGLLHPLVAEMRRWGRVNISGRLRVLGLPKHADFQDLRLTPAETRARLQTMSRPHVVAFQPHGPLHRADEEMTRQAMQAIDGALLLHPAVGLTQPGDVNHFTLIRAHKEMTAHYFEPGRVLLTLLPLATRWAGPREAVWHALVHRNYGANHILVGRDYASPGLDSTGQPFYNPEAAQELVAQYQAELGVTMIPFCELAYLPEEQRYEEASKVGGRVSLALSEGQVRDEYLNVGRKLPEWFTRPEVADILAESHPPRHRQGVCIWFTGLSGSGKSTTAELLTTLLLEHGRQVTLLDGDVVRTHLSKGLGFGKEDRDVNIRRIGFVAAEIARHGGAVICAAVSPYRAARNDVRNMVGPDRFVEVFVDTPIEVCEGRDVKGMYAQARRGEITGFTGLDDPYEPPLNPELSLETVGHTPEQNAHLVLRYLIQRGFVRDEGAS
jgi:sulfate adenylyltransferase